MDAGRAGPPEPHRLEFLAKSQDPVLANVEGVVIKEEFLGLRKHLVRLAEFPCDVLDGPRAPRVAGKRLGPEAERTKGRTTPRGVKRNERMQQEWHIVFFNLHVFLIYIGREGKLVELG